MLSSISDQLAVWVENKQYSQDFISTVSNDLKHREEAARIKVRTLVNILMVTLHFITNYLYNARFNLP